MFINHGTSVLFSTNEVYFFLHHACEKPLFYWMILKYLILKIT